MAAVREEFVTYGGPPDGRIEYHVLISTSDMRVVMRRSFYGPKQEDREGVLQALGEHFLKWAEGARNARARLEGQEAG